MVYLLLGTGFEEIEALTPVDLMRRAGIEIATVGINGKIVTGSHGIAVIADLLPEEMEFSAMDMLILPGGLGGVASIRGSESAKNAIRYAHDHGKWIAAICAGPTILADFGITNGKKVTCYPGCENGMGNATIVENVPFIQDGTVITATSAGCATKFALALISALKGQVAADTVAEQIVIR